MDADENPYQAQFDQWDRYYRTVVLPQQHTLSDTAVDVDSMASDSDEFSACDVSTARTISVSDHESDQTNYRRLLMASLMYYNENMDIPLTTRDSYSEDFSAYGEDVDGLEQILDRKAHASRSLSETSSTFTPPYQLASELHVNNQMRNKYALSPETSAYANALAGVFNDDHEFGNVDDPEMLRHTYLRDFCKSSIEDLRALPDPFSPRQARNHPTMRYYDAPSE